MSTGGHRGPLGRIAALLLACVLGPALVSAGTVGTVVERSDDVAFCGSCHTMSAWIDDMTDPQSDSLAAAHFNNRWIADSQCYSCHAGPGVNGFIAAKIRGLRHSYVYYLGDPDGEEIALYEAFPNENCLGCHAQARGYRTEAAHDLFGEEILTGATSCMDSDCHGSVHPDMPHTRPMRADDHDQQAAWAGTGTGPGPGGHDDNANDNDNTEKS